MCVVFKVMFLQSPSQSLQRRANRGLKGVEFDSTESEFRAQRLKWSFISEGDPKHFTLFHNDSLWPKSILLHERLSMESGRVVTFKTTKNGTFEAQFIGKVKKSNEDEACDRVIEKRKKIQRDLLRTLVKNSEFFFLSFLRKRIISFILILKKFLIVL